VSGYETEGKEPSLETICFLAKYFGVSTDYLLGKSDKRNNVDIVFYNDTVNFKKNFDALPADLKPVVAQTFDSFYVLLNRDMKLPCAERLELYLKLLQLLQSSRAEIRKYIEGSGGSVQDAAFLSDLMAMQSNLKNELCSIIDQLMQADMSAAYGTKRGGVTEFSQKQAT
jgi:transcriptional regulator with XRE-family HTH domain